MMLGKRRRSPSPGEIPEEKTPSPQAFHRMSNDQTRNASVYSRTHFYHKSKLYQREQYRRASPQFYHQEAPRWQQIQWSRQMTAPEATVESVLSLFYVHGARFSCRNLATAAHRAVKIGGTSSLLLHRDDRMRHLTQACISRLHNFDSQGLANTAWAFSKAGIVAPTFFSTIAEASMTKLDEFLPRGLADTAWSFSRAGIHAPDFFNAIAEISIRKVKCFSPYDIAHIALAFATAGIEAPELFNLIAEVTLQKLKGFTLQNIVNTVWAFACVGWSRYEFFVAILSVVSFKEDALQYQELLQLHHTHLHFQLEFPDLVFPLAHIQEMLQSAFQSHEESSSQLQRGVATALDRVHWEHALEYVTPEGFLLDMAQPDKKRAILLHGPSHYRLNTRIENGQTRFKTRLLNRLGWNVVQVPFFEWNVITDASDQEAYLRQKVMVFQRQDLLREKLRTILRNYQ